MGCLGIFGLFSFIFTIIVIIAWPITMLQVRQKTLVSNINIAKLNEQELGLYHIYRSKSFAEPQMVLTKEEESILNEWLKRQNTV